MNHTLRCFAGRAVARISVHSHCLTSKNQKQLAFVSLLPFSSTWLTNNYSASRSFSASTGQAPDIKLYQYHICPFCNITKSVLSYAKLEYEKVEVNPLTKHELKPWSGDYKKVPIAVIDEEQVNGSEQIIDALLNTQYVQHFLQSRWNDETSDKDATTAIMTMQQFQNSENSQKWMRYAVDDLAALLYPNICGTLGDSYDAFSYVKNVDSFTGGQKLSIQLLGSLAMYFAASRVKSKRNITDEKKALQEALDKFEAEGLDNGKLSFCSGLATPDLGDLAVFGVLYSVNGLKAHTDSIQLRGGPVKEWYDRMHLSVMGEKAQHQIKLGVTCD
jgi:microsomal prostaglandin-E synthase 2